MSIIITEMEIPKSCGECNMSATNVCTKWMELKGYSRGSERPDNCPIKSVDGLIERIREMSNANPSYWYTGDMVDREDLIDLIKEYCEVVE